MVDTLLIIKAPIMKLASKFLFFLLLAALPITLFAQGQTIIAAYMKVAPDKVSDYLQVEQAWKKLHVKAIENGVYNGWQLWRKVHAGADDPYQYITLHWFDNYEHTFGENVPENWWAGVYSDAEMDELYAKTLEARTYAAEEVSNLITMVDNPQPVKYLVVHRMKVAPEMANEYVQMETEIFKPFHEELIRRGALAHWGLWRTWPFKEGQHRFVTVNGYKDAAQLTAEGIAISPEELGLDYTLQELAELAQKTRQMAQDELWELVDSAFKEE
jgi:hypothetical protein